MNSSGFRLRGLSFISPSAEPAQLDLFDGLNIVYGASNTGKSFVAKALNFMLGGSRALPAIEEAAPFDAVLLQLIMPNGTPVTLYRAKAGGPYLAFDGLHNVRPEGGVGRTLKPNHDPAATDNLSMFLLETIGLGRRALVKNSTYGEKETLSIRRVAPYVIVDENAIIAEGSPVLSGQYTSDTVERNVLRLLLTGGDDAAVVTTLKPKLRAARVSGQLELLDELIARIDAELGEDGPSREELATQSERLEGTLSMHKAQLQARQERIDELVRERREVIDRLNANAGRQAEIEVTLERFAELDAVFRSDIERLEALEEGGSLLMAISGRPCPLCGSDPENQRQRHGADQIKAIQEAHVAEIAKIHRDRRDLAQTVATLNTDASGLRRRGDRLSERRTEIELELAKLRPKEAELRAEYERLLATRDAVRRAVSLYSERDRLVVLRSQLDVKEPKRKGAGKVSVGIDSSTAFHFAQTIERVLQAWHFPGNPKVSFDPIRYDIQVNGKGREANGKGVRAILHAAFKVAVLVYCRENDLPHPGFLVLDTPLLTYREPIRNHKHGDLSADEIALKSTKLGEYFYTYLHSIRDFAQTLVLENADPPLSALEQAHVTVFTGGDGEGRFGFFPVNTGS